MNRILIMMLLLLCCANISMAARYDYVEPDQFKLILKEGMQGWPYKELTAEKPGSF